MSKMLTTVVSMDTIRNAISRWCSSFLLVISARRFCEVGLPENLRKAWPRLMLASFNSLVIGWESHLRKCSTFLPLTPIRVQKGWAVTRTEPKDHSLHDFMQCAHLREQPTCLLGYQRPCRCVTAHLVFHHQVLVLLSLPLACPSSTSHFKYTHNCPAVRSQPHHKRS